MPDTPVDNVRRTRDDLRLKLGDVKSEIDTLLGQVETRGGGSLSASESRNFDRLTKRGSEINKEIREADDRIDELVDLDRRQRNSAAATRDMGDPNDDKRGSGGMPAYITSEPATYRRGDPSTSFFKDLRNARMGQGDAIERLQRNHREQLETRALGNTSATAGSGGDFAPPGWFIEDFVKLARAGRVTADLLHHQHLPAGISTVNLPKILTGTTTAIQSTQNTSLSQTDMTTGAVSSNVVTIGGKQVVSLQLVEQSGIPFDEVVLGDLAADYARQLDQQVISGSGTGGSLRGLLTVAGTNVAWTSASPAAVGAGGLYQKLGQLAETIHSSRFLPITAWVLHPRRWAWLSVAFDTQNRPLITPSGNGQNSIATQDQVVAQGMAGSLFGVPVYLDPNLPTNLGAGSNQDVILGLRTDDAWLWEGDLKAEAFDAPYADSLGLLLRVYGYAAMVPDRYAASIGTITGTGLISPTFT